MPPKMHYDSAQDTALTNDLSHVFGMFHDISFRDGKAARYVLVSRDKDSGTNYYFTTNGGPGGGDPSDDNSLQDIGHHGMKKNDLQSIADRLKELKASGDYSAANIRAKLTSGMINGITLNDAELKWLSDDPRRVDLMLKATEYTISHYGEIHDKHVFRQTYWHRPNWRCSYERSTVRGEAIDCLAFSGVQADKVMIGAICTSVTADKSLLPPSRQFDKGSEALTEMRNTLTVVANCLKPDQTFGTNEARVLQLVSEGKTVAEINTAVPNHNFDPAKLNDLVALASSVPKSVLVKHTADFLSANPNVAFTHDDGMGKPGITAQDLRLLAAPGTNPVAQQNTNALIRTLNQNQMAKEGLSELTTTEPLVPVMAPLAENNEQTGAPMQLDAALLGQVDRLRAALLSPTPDINTIKLILTERPDHAITYREQIQLIRHALRDSGTPLAQVNSVSEDTARQLLREKLGNANIGIYLSVIVGGDPAKASQELTALETQAATNTTIKTALADPNFQPVLLSLKHASSSGTTTLPALTDQNVVQMQTGIMLTKFNSQLENRPDGKAGLTKAEVATLAGIFKNPNATQANEQLLAFCKAAGLEPNVLQAMYQDKRERRLASNFFDWLSPNMSSGGKNSVSTISNGEVQNYSKDNFVSIYDLNVLAGALQNKPAGSDHQKSQCKNVISNFNSVSGNNARFLLDPKRRGQTTTNPPGTPVSMAPGGTISMNYYKDHGGGFSGNGVPIIYDTGYPTGYSYACANMSPYPKQLYY